MSDKAREEFEEWFSSEFKYKPMVSGSGEYITVSARASWLGWQASRASITVELPNSYNVEQEDYKRWVMDYLDDVGINCI